VKKIQDIYKKTEIEDVDIHDEEISRSPHVLSNDTRCIDDISLMKNRDINLQVPSEIKLQKKRGKNFDALEKKSPFSQLKRSKSITLKKKQKKFSLSLLLLLIHRKIKFLGKGGKILLLFTFLL